MYNYYKRTKEEYEECRADFQRSNWSIINGILRVAIVIVVCLFVMSMTMPLLRRFNWIYAMTLVLLLVMCFYLRRSKKEKSILAAHGVISILYAFAAALAMVYADERSTVFPMLMALLPIMITDTVVKIGILNGVWCILYSLLILRFKNPAIQTYEIFTAITSVIIASISNYLIQVKLLKGYLTHKKSLDMIEELEQTRVELKRKSERYTDESL